jgi:hypothetical protein
MNADLVASGAPALAVPVLALFVPPIPVPVALNHGKIHLRGSNMK